MFLFAGFLYEETMKSLIKIFCLVQSKNKWFIKEGSRVSGEGIYLKETKFVLGFQKAVINFHHDGDIFLR